MLHCHIGQSPLPGVNGYPAIDREGLCQNELGLRHGSTLANTSQEVESDKRLVQKYGMFV